MNLDVVNYVIGFCGKLYPMMYLSTSSVYINGRREKFCYNIKEVDDFVRNNFREDDYKVFAEKNDNRWNLITKLGTFSAYFSKDFSKYNEYFQEYKTPIFMIKEFELVINPSLKAVEFFRIFDAYTAYQEISMFLGNELVEAIRPIPKMNDQVKIDSHGFDKFSFRKEKEKI